MVHSRDQMGSNEKIREFLQRQDFSASVLRHHHLNASRHYQALRHINSSQQLPVGYGALVLLAWVPFVWFKIMNLRLERWLPEESPLPASQLTSTR